MSTSRLADLRVRAAASQVVGLDVRGPVSQALGRAGIVVPPAPLAEVEGEATVPEPAPTATARRPRATPAERVVKPFEEAPWPTRRRPERAPEPPATLSGLTADERRVHRILLDTLARENATDGVSDGLSYAEKRHLGVLNLAFIDRGIAAAERQASRRTSGRWAAVAIAVSLLPLVAVLSYQHGGMDSVLPALALAALAASAAIPYKGRGGDQRLPIYRALRELALLADPNDVTSDVLRQADVVIDRLAGAAPSGVANDTPRLRLDDAPTPTASAASGRTRARS